MRFFVCIVLTSLCLASCKEEDIQPGCPDIQSCGTAVATFDSTLTKFEIPLGDSTYLFSISDGGWRSSLLSTSCCSNTTTPQYMLQALHVSPSGDFWTPPSREGWFYINSPVYSIHSTEEFYCLFKAGNCFPLYTYPGYGLPSDSSTSSNTYNFVYNERGFSIEVYPSDSIGLILRTRIGPQDSSVVELATAETRTVTNGDGSTSQVFFISGYITADLYRSNGAGQPGTYYGRLRRVPFSWIMTRPEED